MALDQSALLDVLEALRTAEVDDRIRQAAETIYQVLIEAELTSVIGAFPTSAPRPALHPASVSQPDRPAEVRDRATALYAYVEMRDLGHREGQNVKYINFCTDEFGSARLAATAKELTRIPAR
jgi:hypothetical protein